ncbi:hypothetical protein CIHG_09440 [Coccidioides immitis H538.4]|uniref:Uncharacterized protein n=1 Tax=Coccidioides immitis H538.4 TaxID=396776 RepID=A0A0J8S4F9_COCIT|nr:hypothetical protein CIHG_09440 [Coccidioides immitis H538.4]
MPACRIFLERIGLIPYLKRVLSEDLDLMHPKERLGLLAGTLSVKYETKRTQGVEPQRWECAARVGDEEVDVEEKSEEAFWLKRYEREVSLIIGWIQATQDDQNVSARAQSPGQLLHSSIVLGCRESPHEYSSIAEDYPQHQYSLKQIYDDGDMLLWGKGVFSRQQYDQITRF